ncbi:MAG: hypothetical protein WDZ45_08535 [Flavobacteriaceae bacterium]
MIKTLLQISSLVFLLVSCKSYVPLHAELTNNELKVVENEYFSDPAKDYVYRAKIEAYGNEFGGIFILKKVQDDLHRIVLTTDFGFKMLDVNVSQNTFQINFIIEQLDRKLILNTLEQDFKTLIKPSYEVIETYESPLSQIYKAKEGNRNYFIFKNKETGAIEKILQTTRTKEKVSFGFDGKNNTFADSIFVNHKDLNLNIYLTQYNQ